MKHFLVYTGLRFAMFAAVYGAIIAVVYLFGAGGSQAWLWVLLGAAVISSALSWRFLAGPRDRFAQSVQERAERATQKFEEMKAKEDTD